MNIRKLNPNEISKEFRRYKIDVENWIIHDKLSNREIELKLLNKMVPNDEIELLLIHGNYELIRNYRKKAMIYIIIGFSTFLIGLGLNFLLVSRSGTGRGLGILAAIGLFGLVSMFRGIFFYLKIRTTKDTSKMADAASKLGEL